MADSFKSRALQKAVRLAGLEEVARRLKATEETVTHWLHGHAAMPDRKFLLLVDLLDELGDSEPSASKDEGA
jgi:hypothetical protein